MSNITPNTAANGGQILTWQERVTPEWLAYWKGRGYNPSEGAMMGEIADLRAALAVTPASEPVKAIPKYLPPPELTWLYTHCRAIGMTRKSDSGKWEHDIALFTINLQSEIETAKAAAPAPVSGMPDLARLLKEARKHIMDWWRPEGDLPPAKSWEFVERLDAAITALPVSQAPDTPRAKKKGPLKQCAASRDGDCTHPECPQLRDNEPHATGRHCPLDTELEDEQ